MNIKEFINKILTGMSVGIVVALIPGALLGEIAKALDWGLVLNLTTISTRLLSVVMGLTIAMQFKLSPIQSATLAITTAIGSGAFSFVDGTLALVGIGDVINAGLTAAFAVFLLQLIGDKLKAYTILLVPVFVVVVVGAIGLFTLPYVVKVTSAIGSMVATFANFTPIVAGILIAITFSLMIVSPLSTAGVAIAISLSGIPSGAANLGICAAGFGLCVAGFSSNGFGTSIAHFLGSPKMQMANFIRKPIMMLPIISNAAICGALAGIFAIQGTPASAGFGISGLIGPLNHLNIVGYSFLNIAITVLIFVVVPIVLALLTTYIFDKKLNIVKPEDYEINFK
ncbi:MAG: PTS transporter subunit IIC [Erysipelotrichaceae bacterium]